MIVEKIWTTRKRNKNRFDWYSTVEKDYKGWFLFGLIPLFIRNTKTSYFESM